MSNWCVCVPVHTARSLGIEIFAHIVEPAGPSTRRTRTRTRTTTTITTTTITITRASTTPTPTTTTTNTTRTNNYNNNGNNNNHNNNSNKNYYNSNNINTNDNNDNDTNSTCTTNTTNTINTTTKPNHTATAFPPGSSDGREKMAASLLPASTSFFFSLALSPSFFLRFLSCWPTFRVPPVKFRISSQEQHHSPGVYGAQTNPQWCKENCLTCQTMHHKIPDHSHIPLDSRMS